MPGQGVTIDSFFNVLAAKAGESSQGCRDLLEIHAISVSWAYLGSWSDMTRFLPISFALFLATHLALVATSAAETGSFQRFLNELWPDAEAAGVTPQVFGAAFANVRPDPDIMALTKSQPEYLRPVGSYIVGRVAGGTISAGHQRMAALSGLLERIEKKFGVERSIIVSIWGLESGYGAVKGNRDVIRSLATLAHARYRDDFFRSQLIAALQGLQAGDVPRDRLGGSWAGAMGQPQFLPSSFVRHAVDFSGDGRRDIWANASDVLASIANYMRNQGWQRGLPWGFEVVIPKGFDYMLSRGSFAEWTERGLRRADGGKLPDSDNAFLLFPSGASGPAFLVTDNYVAIKQYNNSDAYALAVAHLADRLRGNGPFRAKWPQIRPLSREDRIKLQRAFAVLGYRVNNFVGHIDFDLRDGVREIQNAMGAIPAG